jgi:tetratricopeptide (TPR) repeat protein
VKAFEYKAFISYSWSDAKWGNWVHRALESFRTPKPLVGQESELGPVPRSLHPLFKDREEEAAGASITTAVESALAGSEFLLVICSPRSAQSKWVNFEIAWFKAHRDPSKILALIVDGEPGASSIPGRESEECFPRALTHKIDENLQITDVKQDTPLAADARPSGDGKQAAKLKLAAAMLGVRLDELVRRDQKRRALRGRIAITASLSLAAVMSALAWFAIQARNEAEVQRDQAEGLVEYMISDLRENLQPNVQLQVLGGIADRANDYYEVQSNYAMDADALGRRSRVLKLLADLEQDRGDIEKSIQLYRQSVDASARQLSLDPDNPQRILEHAYSLQGLGNTAFEQGDLEFALSQMGEAEELLGSLAERSDATDEWVAEYGSAVANLGIVHFQQRQLDSAIVFLQKAAEIKREAASRPDADWQDRFDFAITLAWMARAVEADGKDAAAAEIMDEENAIYGRMLNDDPDDAYALSAQVNNRVKRAQALLQLGQVKDALAIAKNASADADRVLKFDPEDTTYVSDFASSQIALASALLANGNQDEAGIAAERAEIYANRLASDDPERIGWTGNLLGRARVVAIQVAARGANSSSSCGAALRPAANEAGRLAVLSNDNSSNLRLAIVAAKAALLHGDYEALFGQNDEAKRTWSNAKARLIDGGEGAVLPKDLASNQLLKELNSRLENNGELAPEFTPPTCGF